MPYCESCHVTLDSTQIFEDIATKDLLCLTCSDTRQCVRLPVGQTILGREFDYDVSYSRKDGIKATARLGTATLNLHIPQEEIVKVIG